MKKLVTMIISILAACLLLGIASSRLQHQQGNTGDNSLVLYNWGDYIDPSLIKKFEKQTGYHVILETFDSNEAMLTKIRQGGTTYDLTVPSDYMIQKMRKEKLLLPIDHQKVPTFKNIDSRFLNQDFDPNNKFSVPYFWGTLGIIYNDQKIKPGEVKHWRDLWQPKYHNQIMLIDSARDVLGFSLIEQGYSVNTTNYQHLQKAENKLDQLAPNVKATVADEIKMYMIENEAPLAVDWSGEASEMLSQNSHLHYVVPSEGSNLWFDNFVIPKTAKHFKAIYAFLNFMQDPKNAAQNAEYIGYATPNREAKKLLPASIQNDQQFYPPANTLNHLEVYEDLSPKVIETYNDLYLEFKMHH